MNNQLLLCAVLGLAVSTGACAGTSLATGFGGEMNLQGMTDSVKEAAIKQLQDAKNKAKAELQAKLEKEMRAQLEKGFKTIDEEFEKKLKELKG